MRHDVLTLPDGRQIAYRQTSGAGPGVVFLGGFRSDMTGTKAEFLENWARGAGRAFLRFDYTGHGASSGRFEDGTIGAWAADAREAVCRLTEGPQILVGSSMGGWIMLLLARSLPERVAGLIGIAAAPDFTEELVWAGMSRAERVALLQEGRLERPTEYADTPHVYTRALIEDGRRHRVLAEPLPLPFPVRLLHGSADADVPLDLALRLLDHADAADMRLTLVKGADHRFSSPDCLALLARTLDELMAGTVPGTGSAQSG